MSCLKFVVSFLGGIQNLNALSTIVLVFQCVKPGLLVLQNELFLEN